MIAFREGARLASGLYDEIVVDCFAGGGGASTGIEAALGRSVDIAINHDREAVELHRVNHPHARHYCEDIFQVDPLEATGGRPVGLAWFSPDCKHFSKAKGGRPVSPRVRGLAWVVVRWARAVRPRLIMLENVEEFQTWGPLGPDLRPCPRRKGRTFRRWIRSLEQLGYAVEWRELRACDQGTPTIRKRLFLVAKRDGDPINWPAPTHGPVDPAAAVQLAPWRTAAECIDWSIPCPSIFDRKRPLKPATLRRIAAGIKRFVLDAAQPFIVNMAHGGSVESSHAPSTTIKTEKGGCRALVAPTLIETGWGEREGQAPRAPGLDRPLGTVCAGGGKHALVAAFMAQHNTGVVGHPVRKPLSTITAVATQQNLVAAALVGCGGRAGQSRPRGLDESTATQTAKADGCLVAAHLTTLRGTSRAGRSAAEPCPTLTAGGTHVGAVAAFLTSYYGNERDGSDARSPLRVITTKERHAAVIVEIDGNTYAIADIGMRMLTPRELYRCQGFPDSYVIDRTADGKAITKTAQVRMCGNSVCPPMAEALVRANIHASHEAVAA